MELIYVQAVLMGNGEIICDGKTIGYESKIGKFCYEVVSEDKAKEEVIIKKLK